MRMNQKSIRVIVALRLVGEDERSVGVRVLGRPRIGGFGGWTESWTSSSVGGPALAYRAISPTSTTASMP